MKKCSSVNSEMFAELIKLSLTYVEVLPNIIYSRLEFICPILNPQVRIVSGINLITHKFKTPVTVI